MRERREVGEAQDQEGHGKRQHRRRSNIYTPNMPFVNMASRLDAVMARLDTQAKMTTINKSGSIVKSLESTLATGNLQKMSETMDQFEKHFVTMEVQAEFMESAMAEDYGVEVSVGLPHLSIIGAPGGGTL
ncbi:hypothetical protein CsatA_005905 [Cannabis sativa]